MLLSGNYTKAAQVLFLWALASVCGAVAMHGLVGGLIRKRVMKNPSTREYATGGEAVSRGWVYLIAGSLGFAGIGWFAYLYAVQP